VNSGVLPRKACHCCSRPFPAARIPVTCSRLQAWKENEALYSAFGYVAVAIVHTKVHVFLKPYNQGGEEARHYGSVEDAGLMYSHGCRDYSP